MSEPAPTRQSWEHGADQQPKVHEIGNRTYLVAQVDPLDVDGVRTVQVGTLLFALAFLGQLPFVSQLRADGHLWWLWTCAAGVGFGLLGWTYCWRRRRMRAAGHPPRDL